MRSSKDELRSRLLAVFREEAADHLRSITGEMARLDATPGDEEAALAAVNGLFRTVHTLKGAARSLSIRTIEQACHEIEDLCSALVNRRAALDGRTRAVLHELADDLGAITAESLARFADAASVPGNPPELSEPAPPLAPEGGEAGPPRPGTAAARPAPLSRSGAPAFVRLDVDHIQRLGMMAEDLLAPKLATRARLDEARGIAADLAAVRLRRAAAGRPRDAGEGDDLRALDESLRHLLAALSEDERLLRSVVDRLVVELRQARMMPATDLLAVFPAMAADLGREAGKAIRWQASGGDLLIDRQIAELIKDPLLHVVRNAVDHGIEPAEERQRLGKPAEGTVAVAIAPVDGGRVRIEVSDDGRGIDAAAVRAAAVRSRLHTREAMASWSDAEVMDLVFHPTLSTTSMISAVSGRGLGLAIVRERAERLGGDARVVRSAPGAGTAIALEVPAALANFRGIGMRAGAATIVCPLETVERSIGLPALDCEMALRRGGLQLDDEVMPIGELAAVLGLAPAHDDGRGPAMRSGVVLRQGGRRGVILVDALIGECEVVVKELRPPLLRVRNVMAAGLMGSGELSLVLRVGDVLDALASRAGKVAQPVERRRRHGKARLLVVDDSITTRAMEVGLLEAAGYEVRAAADGAEAWSILQDGEFDAVISDVDMPNMDGFALTEKIRADRRLSDLPIVLVTALERREDHDRGIRLGANAYMLKSAFDQSMLIDLVRRVL